MSTGKTGPVTDWRTLGERTRRQLEELDALLERMLALPPLNVPEAPSPDAESSESPTRALDAAGPVKSGSFGDSSAQDLGAAILPSPSVHSQTALHEAKFVATSEQAKMESGGQAPRSQKEPNDLAKPSASPFAATHSAGITGGESLSTIAQASDDPRTLPTRTPQAEAKLVEKTSSATSKTPALSSPSDNSVSQAVSLPDKGPAWLLREDTNSVPVTPSEPAQSPSDTAKVSLDEDEPPTQEGYRWLRWATATLWQTLLLGEQAPTLLNWLGWIGILLLLGSAALWLGVWLSWHW
ncbi:MAG: hypothetical protein RMI91_07790 [Gemmatales bacterium]|nr:hypothetical protein [Gemmatales bacterium]MDW7994541.1 hypothetical protein [Gemmatales bacterium]